MGHVVDSPGNPCTGAWLDYSVYVHHILHTKLQFRWVLLASLYAWYKLTGIHIHICGWENMCSFSDFWWFGAYISVVYFHISMGLRNTAVTPLLAPWSHCSLALSHRYRVHRKLVSFSLYFILVTDRFNPRPLRLHHQHWSSHVIAPVPGRQHCEKEWMINTTVPRT